jgi:hypothetical protein
MAFSQDLEDVLRTVHHHVENLVQKVNGHIFMKKIAHGIDKNFTWRAPLLGLIQPLRMQRELKALWKIVFETQSYSFGIAMLTSWADFITTCCGVPRFVSPLNSCMCASHCISVTQKWDVT